VSSTWTAVFTAAIAPVTGCVRSCREADSIGVTSIVPP
jgi:hypothetical protein